MGVSGLWAQRAQSDYTGATRWGTGTNPIHGSHDGGRGREIGTRENLIPLGDPSGAVQPDWTAGSVDWLCDGYGEERVEGESFRYTAEHPRWGEETPQFRGASTSPAMGEQPPWGVYYDSGPDGFPLGGPTGGTQAWVDVSHGEAAERQHAIAVPSRFVSGGWLGKVRGEPSVPESQESAQPGFQWTINNASVQGPGRQLHANDRAVGRATDDPRSAVASRTAGASQKVYALSFAMGGGEGTPDMFPQQQTAGFKRPFFTRAAATPPVEPHTWNTMEGRRPFQRQVPADPDQGDSEAGGMDVSTGDWGY